MDDVVNESVAGLDIHEKIIIACVMYTPKGKSRVKKEFGSFSTTTKGLLALNDWLQSFQVDIVSMESTGVYWKCVWRILQNSFQLILANPRMIKGIPGKKTDMKDAEWIARLTRLGVVPKSFVPEEPIQELRDWTRLRKRYVEDVNREKNRTHKILQCAGIKLANVIRDIFGKSGRNLLKLLVEGKKITEELVKESVYTSAKKKVPALMDAMDGFINTHYQNQLAIQLEMIDFKEKQIKQIEAYIDECLSSYTDEVQLLDEIPGIDKIACATIIAEIGIDMSEFPTSKHLCSWAGVCPGNNESAGKQKSKKIRKGNRYLKKILAQAAHSIAQGKNGRMHSFFWRVQHNAGYKKAIIATCGLYLRIIYEMLRTKAQYIEFGEDYRKKLHYNQ